MWWAWQQELSGKPLKALFSEIRERQSVTGFSLWFIVSSVLLLYVYFTLYNASGTFFETLQNTVASLFHPWNGPTSQSCWRALLRQTGWSVFQSIEYAVIKNILKPGPVPIWTQHGTGPRRRPALKKLRFNSGGLAGRIQQQGLKPSISHSSSLDRHVLCLPWSSRELVLRGYGEFHRACRGLSSSHKKRFPSCYFGKGLVEVGAVWCQFWTRQRSICKSSYRVQNKKDTISYRPSEVEELDLNAKSCTKRKLSVGTRKLT